jgi:hypothetical protein
VYRLAVNRRERRASAASGGMIVASEKPSHQGAVRGTLSYVAGGPTTITLAQLQFIEPERVFPADCGGVRLRLESPELHFAQLDPYQETSFVRTLVVRFERGRFVERAKANEQFRLDLEEKLKAKPDPIEHRAPRTAGRLTELFDRALEARSKGEPEPPPTALVDAEFDMMSYSGGRASVVLLAASQLHLAAALNARASEVFFDPILEVTMTTALLADLLISWKKIAESIA